MEDNIKHQKSVLRKEVLLKRESLSEECRRIASKDMTNTLLQQTLYSDSENILCFVSYGSEINTFPFMEEVIASGKKLFVPRIIGDEMLFIRISSLHALVPGYKGILEPCDTTEVYCYDNETAEKSFLIIPGVAFDIDKHRMGYGKGFYDRYLSDKEQLINRSVAVGFQCQMVEQVPNDIFDKKPGKILVF